MIAVTFALPTESRELRRRLRGDHGSVALCHTGVGPGACRQRLPRFLEEQRPVLVISSGFAGGLNNSLGVGDLFLAENFSHPPLLERAQDFLIARVGTLASAGEVIGSAEQRSALAARTRADAVDMETAVIATACAARQVPLLSLRAISDTAAAPFPAPPAVLFDLQRQRTRALPLATYLLRHPASLPRFLHFSRQVARARANLTEALLIILRELEGKAVDF